MLPPALAFALTAPPIAGGEASTDHPGVVAIVGIRDGQGQVYCSGTVIEAGWVLTTATCMLKADADSAEGWTPYAMQANDLLREEPQGSSVWIGRHTAPGYPEEGSAADLGLIQLAEPIGEPIPLMAADIDETWVGRELSVVGFGWTDAENFDAGTKRQVELPITSVQEATLLTQAEGAGLCVADVGGAALVQEDDAWVLATVPVHYSNSDASSCLGGEGTYVRLEPFRDWIQTTLDGGPQDTGSTQDTSEDTGPQDSGLSDDGGRCSSAPGSALGLPLGLVGLLLLRRRRDRKHQP